MGTIENGEYVAMKTDYEKLRNTFKHSMRMFLMECFFCFYTEIFFSDS